MAQVTEGIYFIQGQDDFIPDSHVYVIGHPSSQDLSLVDAGLMGKGNYKIRAIEKDGIPIAHIKRIIMTHTHLDHIGCLPELLKAMPGAEVWVHSQEGEPMEKGDDRSIYGMDMFRSMCQAQYGIRPETFRLKVHRKLENGEVLEMGGMTWEVLHIPGHSLGSIGLYHRPKKVLIPGDVIYADYAIGRFDLYGADGPTLLRSLKALSELEVEILLPGHNRIVKGLPRDYTRKTTQQWGPYLT